MKQLDKNGVAIKLTKKNYKKIYKTLRMFKERLEYSREDQLDTQLENPQCAFGFNGTYWCVLSPINKVLIKHKQLRNILYAEHCKEGDYIICRNVHYGDLNSDFIVKFKSSDFIPDSDGDYTVNYSRAYCTKDERQLNRNWLRGQFIRYATQEEIDLLEREKEKIAVRVDNEKEFNALMEYYDSLGWTPYSEYTLGWFKNGEAIDFHNNYRSTSVGIQVEEGYKIIPFSEFAKEHGIEAQKPSYTVNEYGMVLEKGNAMPQLAIHNPDLIEGILEYLNNK